MESVMLKKFSVENFKGFQEKLVLDLGAPSNYNFSQKAIYEGVITKGILFGINGSGKSNLGLAVCDIISHLTDNQVLSARYDYYLNMNNPKSYAEFEYVFVFHDKEVIYQYRKSAMNKLEFERLSIEGREVIYYDHLRKEGFTRLEGTETLNNTIRAANPISRVKYVNSNAILPDNCENAVFHEFISYVERMLLFYSLDHRGYEGFQSGGGNISEEIIKSGKLSEFQQFLKENEITYDLAAEEIDGEKKIYCRFENQKKANFFKIASTGTRSLTLFYYWYTKMREASFVYIDEFDAFYHFELAKNIIKRLYEIEHVQIFTTTHNTDLMSNDLLRPDCYFILENNKITSLAGATDKELRKAHNLQKMYKAGAFDGKDRE